jgi:hypothetical protein
MKALTLMLVLLALCAAAPAAAGVGGSNPVCSRFEACAMPGGER